MKVGGKRKSTCEYWGRDPTNSISHSEKHKFQELQKLGVEHGVRYEVGELKRGQVVARQRGWT